MDPFLEHPDFFPNLHDSFITHSMEFLQARLPEPYFAVTSERLWVEITERRVEPDVDVLVSNGDAPRETNSTGAAVAVRTRSQPVVITIPHDESRETFVEIRTKTDRGERIVTTIELLSWTNKTPGEHGRELYVKKQQELFNAPIHLVEIDLLRGGEHTTLAPRRKIRKRVGRFDYHVCVHRFDKWVDCFVYATRLEEPLPEVAVPLLPGDGDVPLDLQAVFDRCYDAGPYRRRVRYDPSQIVPPLPAEQLAWVTQRLRERGEAAVAGS
jgi:hypothetical protein